jgi:hypothetical protein
MIAKEDALPVRTQCAIAAVNRSTWYYQEKEEPEANVKLMNLIDEIHLDDPRSLTQQRPGGESQADTAAYGDYASFSAISQAQSLQEES